MLTERVSDTVDDTNHTGYISEFGPEPVQKIIHFQISVVDHEIFWPILFADAMYFEHVIHVW